MELLPALSVCNTFSEVYDLPFNPRLLIYLSHRPGHPPFQAPQGIAGMYDDADVKGVLPKNVDPWWYGKTNGNVFQGVMMGSYYNKYRKYCETLTAMDRDIVRLLDKIDEMGLRGNTVVIYMDGESLVPIFQNPKAQGRKAFLMEFWRYYPENTPSYLGVRTDRYKYIEFERGRNPWLFDLEMDPKELNNLYGKPEGEKALSELEALLEGLKIKRIGSNLKN